MQTIIYRRDGTNQIINHSLAFESTERIGSGKHAKILTPEVKSSDLAHDLAKDHYLAHKLIKES